MKKVFFRRICKVSLSLFLILSLLLSTVAVVFGSADTKGHWAEDAVTALEGRKIIEGYPDGTFKPDKAVTRAEFVTLLNRATGIAPSIGEIPFTDLKAGDWFLGQIAAATAKGYIAGYPDKTFRPNQLITRQEAATMLSKLLELQGSTKNDRVSFTDTTRIGTWAKEGIAAAINAGLFQGYPDKSFRPEQKITRAETAATLQRALPLIQNLQLVKKVNNGEEVNGNLILGKDGATVGPEGKQTTIHGNVTITGENVTLKNLVITGDLTIDQAVEQDFTAQNVTVQGITHVNGGAPTTVRFKDSTLTHVTMNKENVRLSLEGNTSVSGTITINVVVTLELNTTGKVAKVDVKANGVTITGTGTIGELVKGANITIHVTVKVEKTTTTGTATNPPAGGGSGGGSGGTTPEIAGENTLLQLKLVGTYDSKVGLDKGGSEIVDFDPKTNYVYSTNSATKSIDILKLNHDGILTVEKSVYFPTLIPDFTADGITSVAVNPNGGYLAAAVPADPKTNEGKVVFLTTDGRVITSVYVGSLPDMLTFTPDGSKVLVANEGEPNNDYTIDPMGSVSIIEVPATINGDVYSTVKNEIDQGDVTTITFEDNNFVGGKQKIDQGVRIFGPNATAAQDLEPEYITTDGKIAYVSLQENNAIAVLDLNLKKFVTVKSLGAKDHSISGNGLDASDKDGKMNIKPWPVLGLYLPDGIALYQKDGKNYLLTANEGDSRDYATFSEEKRIKDLKNNISLKADHYKGFTQSQLDKMANDKTNNLFNDDQLGRLNVTTAMGKNADGKYEALYSFGTRSFSVWDLGTVTGDTYLGQIYDSGDDFEQILAEKYPAYFNADNTDNKFDGRSDNKGPEPEYVTIGSVNGVDYAFVGLERMGGVMVYNISDPLHPRFENYFTSRNFSNGTDGEPAGDLGPEGLKFVPAEKSPTGKALLITGNETSGTVSVYEITTKTGVTKITFLHTNDTHAHLDDAARRANVIKQIEAERPNALLIDAGDVFSGTLYFTKYQGQADVNLMNLMGYDLMTFGNHEFDKGSKVLADFIRQAHFPLVSSNVTATGDTYLSSLYTEGGEAKNSKIQPYVVKSIGGQKIGFIGLTTETTREISSPSKETIFKNAIESARNTIALLNQQDINKIVVISHLGIYEDRTLAKEVEGIDLIIGGHTHTKLDHPEVVLKDSQDITPTLIVQTGANGENLGRLDVTFDSNGNIILEGTRGELVPINASLDEEQTAKTQLDQYKVELDAYKNTVVGYAPVALEQAKVRSEETNLGNLITDGMVWKANTLGKKADIAIQNGGGIRASIDQGDITLGEILTVMPFGNTLALADLTGEQIWTALENGVSQVEQGAGRFPQVSGLRFSWDPNKPAGQRIWKVEVKNVDGTYSPIDRTKTYRVATNGFMLNGGDGYSVFNGASYREDLGFVDYQVLLDYLQYLNDNKLSIPGVEGRITKGQTP
ncbi:putative 5'-nucleotidase [[Clostridium] ultunense Esp]|nr:putative 5'-nucleotidase [[Clostridium] ultunense Esp]